MGSGAPNEIVPKWMQADWCRDFGSVLWKVEASAKTSFSLLTTQSAQIENCMSFHDSAGLGSWCKPFSGAFFYYY